MRKEKQINWGNLSIHSSSQQCDMSIFHVSKLKNKRKSLKGLKGKGKGKEKDRA